MDLWDVASPKKKQKDLFYHYLRIGFDSSDFCLRLL